MTRRFSCILLPEEMSRCLLLLKSNLTLNEIVLRLEVLFFPSQKVEASSTKLGSGTRAGVQSPVTTWPLSGDPGSLS